PSHPRPLRRRRGERRRRATRHRPGHRARLHRRDQCGAGADGLTARAMAANRVSIHSGLTCAVEVAPSEVDARAELTVTVRAACPRGCDLTGQSVSIRDRDGIELACAELQVIENGAFGTGVLALRAPVKVGEHVLRAVLAAQEKDGVRHSESATAFSFTAMAHAASVNVWGLPSAISAGGGFSFKAGAKLSAGRKLAGRAVGIIHDEGAQVSASQTR